ncbi:MAG: hypothetical protein AzoDbin1_04110 [Azoarcus sp.]|nr:hypothetical protein [Azoarcus sp.]
MVQLEERYVVLKIADIKKCLAKHERDELGRICQTITAIRSACGEPTRQYLVIEHDWPEYRPALEALRTRVQQEQCSHEWKWHQIAGEGQICRMCGARNFDCDD